MLFQNFSLIGIAYKLFCMSLFSVAFLDSNLKFSGRFLQGGSWGKVRNWSILPIDFWINLRFWIMWCEWWFWKHRCHITICIKGSGCFQGRLWFKDVLKLVYAILLCTLAFCFISEPTLPETMECNSYLCSNIQLDLISIFASLSKSGPQTWALNVLFC